jgi:tetratricopeptide (TPR) repeat protein
MYSIELKQARHLWKEGKYEHAHALYEELLEHDPENAKICREYGRAVFALIDDLEKATDIFQLALSKEPASLVTLLYLGELYSSGYGEGYTAALPVFQRVLALAPQDSPAYLEALMGIGMLLNKPGKPVTYEEVLDAFHQITVISPTNAHAHHNTAEALYSRGNVSESQKEWEIAQQLYRSQGETGRVDSIQKDLDCIKNNQRIIAGHYSRDSVTSEWPDVDFDDVN